VQEEHLAETSSCSTEYPLTYRAQDAQRGFTWKRLQGSVASDVTGSCSNRKAESDEARLRNINFSSVVAVSIQL
jgi:hypothetical protein